MVSGIRFTAPRGKRTAPSQAGEVRASCEEACNGFGRFGATLAAQRRLEHRQLGGDSGHSQNRAIEPPESTQIGYSCDVATPAAPDPVLVGLEEKIRGLLHTGDLWKRQAGDDNHTK